MPSSDEVDDGKQDDPHEINEVPVEADRLDAAVVVLRVFPWEHLGQVQVDHRHDAAGDVEAVEPGHREEGGAVQPRRRGGGLSARPQSATTAAVPGAGRGGGPAE